jgi:hypothetical protein
LTSVHPVLKNENRGKTPEQQIGDDMLQWSEEKVKHYSALSGICNEAWEIIVTTFEWGRNLTSEDAVTKEVTPVTFTETLLREILSLNSEQQLELVKNDSL